ncbi:MAP6 domain-containing protein 1 [Varanus komodoensis]|uniref:MAP6 domain-containing protein 1 n=1 Tax=Varanus komodoensis TaxID=61221 RepID=UPI001CF7B3D9|nr:MAP6 domain-containing protein 1 [Varanus komodoensis]KAF7253373.1 MAP6 domain-containing protein 1 [Varanus komodoensis]
MAWPCISRVCCLARFWNQLDKSDLAVPLTIHNYSDIEEPAEEGADAAGGSGPQQPRIPTGGSTGTGTGSRAPAQPRATAALPVSASAPSLQQQQQQPDSLVGARRPSKKTSHRKEPFAAETQYQQDFRAWPVQKRDALPWVGDSRRGEPPGAPPVAAGASAEAAHAGMVPGGSHVYVLPAGGQQVGSKYSGGFKQVWASSSPPGVPKTTSYRHEYRPWTGAKRSRPTKTTQGFIIPEDHFVQESSYRADFKFPEAKAKFSPNPSAVFQAPSRILNV